MIQLSLKIRNVEAHKRASEICKRNGIKLQNAVESFVDLFSEQNAEIIDRAKAIRADRIASYSKNLPSKK